MKIDLDKIEKYCDSQETCDNCFFIHEDDCILGRDISPMWLEIVEKNYKKMEKK